MGTTVLAVLAFGVGALIVVTTLLSAIMTLVVPRALPVMITRWVFSGIRTLFRLRGMRARSFEARDRDLALYGPISLFSLAATWLVLTGTGYMLMFWSLGERPLRRALVLSGSSIYTLGFEVPPNLPTTLLAFSEAGLGLVLLAMLISYLLSMYQSFQRREAAVAALDVRASTPPTATALLVRSSIIGGWDRLEELWRDWETWFVDVTETHTSLPALVFFRSPHWEHSWVTASGAVLDGASLLASTVDRPRSPDAELLHPRRVRRHAPDRRFLRHPAQPRPLLARGVDLDRPAGVRPGVSGACRRRGASQGRPGAGVARLRRLAGQLRPGAAVAGRADHGPVRAVVLGPVDDRADGPATGGAALRA